MSMNSTLNITFQEQVQAYHAKIDQQLDQTLQLLRSKLLAQQELDRARCEQQRENFCSQVDQELGRQMLDIDKWRQSQQTALINALQFNPQSSQGSIKITKSTLRESRVYMKKKKKPKTLLTVLNDDMKNIPDLETESLPNTAVPTPVGITAIDFEHQPGHEPNQSDWVRNCPSPMKKNERRRSSISSGTKYSLGSIDYPPDEKSVMSPEHRPPKPCSPSCESMTTVHICPTEHGESPDARVMPRVMPSVAPDAPVMPRGLPIAPLARTVPEIPRHQRLNLSPRIVPQHAPGNRALLSFQEPMNHSVPSKCNYQTIRPREKGFSERRCASPIVLARESVRQMPAAFKPYAFGVPSSETKSYAVGAQRQESFGRRSSPVPIPRHNRSPKLIPRDCRSPPRVMPWFARQQGSPAPKVERQVIIPKGAIIYRYNSRRELVPKDIQR